MDIKEAEILASKTMRTILSCRTTESLNIAVRYSELAYRRLAKEIGLVNNMQFICRVERAIGFAQCQIKHAT